MVRAYGFCVFMMPFLFIFIVFKKYIYTIRREEHGETLFF